MMSRAEPALRRLLQSDPALRREIEGAICDFLRRYNPEQPRVSAGDPAGGQWARTGAGQPTGTAPGQGSYGLPLDTSSLLLHPSYSSPASAPLHTLTHEALLDHRGDFVFDEPKNDGTFRPLDPMGDFDLSAHPKESLISSLGLELYRWLSASNDPNSQTVVKFVATGFSREQTDLPFDLAGVERLNRDEVKSQCPGIDFVQALTDEAVAKVIKEHGSSLSPTLFGTYVHSALQQEINSVDENGVPKYLGFQAEVSAIKTAEANDLVPYGLKGSVRVDVLELADSQTVCVYDIKSGTAGLTLPRMKELADNARNAFGPVRYLIIIEIRPTIPRGKGANLVKQFCGGTKSSIFSTLSVAMPTPGRFNL